jgi:D-psicose/D-tagatose/L-ribulose 3-epimerase
MENKIGIHALVLEREWNTETAIRSVETAASIGYDVLELPVFDPTCLAVDSVRRAAEERGLLLTCSLGLPFDADVSSTDEAVAARGEHLLADVIDTAAALGAGLVAGVIHSAMGKHGIPADARNRSTAARLLGRLADRAAGHGIVLGLEVVNRYESNLVNTAASCAALVEAIGRENVVIHLDSYHMNIEERSALDAVLDCRGGLGYVHIGESNRGYLGAGSVDLAGFVRALDHVDYRGIVTFEAFSRYQVAPELAAALSLWREVWADPNDLARHALSTLRTTLWAESAGIEGKGSSEVPGAP